MELVRESFEIGPGSEPARQHVVDTLRTLIGAEVVACVKDTSFALGLTRAIEQVTLARFDSESALVFPLDPFLQWMTLHAANLPVGKVTTAADHDVLERST